MKPKKELSVGFLFDDTLDSSSGVAQYVKILGAWLGKRGHHVSYMVGETQLNSWAGGQIYSLARNQKVIFNGNHLSIPWPANRRRIAEVLAKESFDVLHVQMPHSPFLSQRILKLASPQTAVVGTFHIFPSGFIARAGSRFLRLLYGHGLKLIDETVSVSPPAGEFAKQAFGLNTQLSSNVVDVSQIRSAAGNTIPQDGHIIFLGRLVKRKGAHELLKAFSILAKEFPTARLTIAGDGPQIKKLKKFASQNYLNEEQVRFLGFIEESDKSKLLASAHIACFPSLYGESFGIVLIEAMAAGAKVVLGGKNPGYISVLGEQPELIVEPNQTTAFAAQLKKLLTDEDLTQELYDWQTRKVKQYDVEKVGPQIERLYHQAIAKRRSARHN